MTLADWFQVAKADAERRGLPALVPLLDMLRRSTTALRTTDWGAATDDVAGDATGATVSDRRDGRS